MIKASPIVVLALVLIGIADLPLAAQVLPLPQVVTGEVPPPGNDDFDAATVVTTMPFNDTIDTSAATGHPDDPVCDGQCGTVWYRYTPEETFLVGITTYGSDYDTQIFVFTGERSALELVQEGWESGYRLRVVAGTTYHFMVMSTRFDLTGGRLNFSLTDRPPLSLGVSLEPEAVMNRQSGVITLRGEITCSLPSQVYVGIALHRYLAQRNLGAGAYLLLACPARAPFEIDVQTYSASRFGDYYPPGHYLASVFVNGYDTSLHEPADAYLFDFPLLVRGAPRR